MNKRRAVYHDLTHGSITYGLIAFALPMIAGNLMQQFYNIADTLIVGRVLGRSALAAVGSAYTLMTFLNSIFIGLSMGCGALFSVYHGGGERAKLKSGITHAAVLIALITALINIAAYVWTDGIMRLLNVPDSVYAGMRLYLVIVFAGMAASSLYNFIACLLRALGNSSVPLIFLAVSAVLNIILDIIFVAHLGLGIGGAAAATVISQYVSALGIGAYMFANCRELIETRAEMHFDKAILSDIWRMSSLTCAQQSVMNFGILMVQGLVNSFGAVTMAAFAAAVKIDTFAYLPVQDFGNAYSTFTAQNFGAGNNERIREGTRKAFMLSAVFSLVISAAVFAFARPLMSLFVAASETDVISAGVRYLRIEGSCYIGIGWLFLLYGYYRAIKQAGMSVVLTVISLGTRVLLAYLLSSVPVIGETGIWAAIPIGWALADAAGLIYMRSIYKKNSK